MNIAETEIEMMLEELARAVETVEFVSINGRVSDVRINIDSYYLGIHVADDYKISDIHNTITRFLEKNNTRYEFLRQGGQILIRENRSWKLFMRKKVS